MKSMHCIVKGKVQGVNFRAWTFDQARNLNITGWVRNLDNDKVEVIAQGVDANLSELKKRLLRGSPVSQVEDVRCEEMDYDKEYDSFEIRG